MKIHHLLLLLFIGCGSAETTTYEPCPPRPKNCPSCSSVFQEQANPADICPTPQIVGCGNPWGALGGCTCSKCPAACGCVSPKNSEPCLSCLKASCSPELNACLADK